MKRCPNCGASNPESAEWCNQCLERFDRPQPESEPLVAASMADADSPPEVAEAIESAGEGAGDGAAGAAPGAVAAGPFKVTEEGIRWVCSVCDNENPLEASLCSVCGTTFADAMQPKIEREPRDAGTAALVSLFMPGAGHAYLGLWSQAITRAILSIWVVTVVVAGILLRDTPGASALAIVFGVVAFALWVIAAHDAYREARGETRQVLLRGRAFLFLVLGLLGLLFVLILGAGFTARS